LRKYALIGKDVGFSASPAMMNAALAYMGIKAGYYAVNVNEEQFEYKLEQMLAENDGINVTMPYKSKVIKHLDALDQNSERINAVNTIKVNSKIQGFNTDVYGIIEPLRIMKMKVKRAILIGTGGAARAFCLAMENQGCEEIVVWDRNLEKTKSFSTDMAKLFPEILFKTEAYFSHYDLLFNATPMGGKDIGLTGEVERLMKKVDVVFDAVYYPYDTGFTKKGESLGCSLIRGYEMLLYQGAEALRIWLNQEPPIEIMKSALLKYLTGETKR
jgi:shikimate dehydrogenase